MSLADEIFGKKAKPRKAAPILQPVRPLSPRPAFDWERVRQRGDTIGLSFSNGKDSLALWLDALERGFKVVPFIMQVVPDLQFVERSLRFYEKFFGTHIYRLAHPNFYQRLSNMGEQPIHRKAELLRIFKGDEDIELFSYLDVERGFRRTAGLPLNTWIATGVRMSDSAARQNQMGTGYNPKDCKFKPLRNWKTQDVVNVLNDYGCPLPVDYKIFGRSFDGVDARFLIPLKEHFPDDYATVLKWFPDAALQIHRVNFLRNHKLLRGNQ